MPLISVVYREQNKGIINLVVTDNVYIPMFFFFFGTQMLRENNSRAAIVVEHSTWQNVINPNHEE